MSSNFIREDLAHAKALGLSAHKQTLLCEIDLLKSKLQPHDAGHIHTTISVLVDRCKEIEQQIQDSFGLTGH